MLVPKFNELANAPGITDAVVAPLLMWSGIIGCFIVPLFASKIISEEKLQNGDVLLFNSPLTSSQLVTSRLVAVVSFIGAYIALICLYPLSISFATTLDWGRIAAGLFGIALLLVMIACLSNYIASYTASTALAMVCTLLVLGVLIILYTIGIAQSAPSKLFVYISAFSHFFEFLNGIVSGRAIGYFVTFSIWLLALNILRYQLFFR